MKKLLARAYESARIVNNEYIAQSIKSNGDVESILDVGCWDGNRTMDYAEACHAKKLFGIEMVKEMAEEAEKKGIKCFALQADKETWPFDDNSIDCVVSNQVVEHLSDLDHYFKEASRVLKKGGILVTSTNNLASWHNIFALLFGWAPFDLTNSSKLKKGIGNPLAVHRNEKVELATWTHRCVYTPRWLFEWQNVFSLKKENQMAAGFYPFPAVLGSYFKNHAAFMILTTRKS